MSILRLTSCTDLSPPLITNYHVLNTSSEPVNVSRWWNVCSWEFMMVSRKKSKHWQGTGKMIQTKYHWEKGSKAKVSVLESRHPWLCIYSSDFTFPLARWTPMAVCDYWFNLGWTKSVQNMKFSQHFCTPDLLILSQMRYPLGSKEGNWYKKYNAKGK